MRPPGASTMGDVNWGTVDWSLTDAEIGRRVGRTRSWVGQVRSRLRIPRSPAWHCPFATARRLIEAMSDTVSMTPGQVAGAVGCSQEYAEQCLRALGRPYLRRPGRPLHQKYDWGSVTPEQWKSMTDKQVARMLGVSNVAVVSQWRRRNGIRKRPPQ